MARRATPARPFGREKPVASSNSAAGARAAAVTAVLVAGAAAWWAWGLHGPAAGSINTDSTSTAGSKSSGGGGGSGSDGVPVWEWQPERPFAAEAVAFCKPVVLRNTVVTTWPAMRRWSTKYLASHATGSFGTVARVYRNNASRFFGPYYDPTRPLAGRFPHAPNLYELDATATVADLLEAAHPRRSPQGRSAPDEDSAKSDGGPWAYYSGELDRFGQWAFDDIEPYGELLSPMPSRSSVNLWMGSRGVTAHCHFDGYHNFYAQIRGRKRFTLVNPSRSDAVRPYPFLHPCHAQCQANLSVAAEAASVPTVTVELSKGDLLYLPPLHFHHVESLDASVSVNVWTDSAQTALAERMLGADAPPLPRLTGVSPEVSRAWGALFVVVATLSRCAHTETDPVGFVAGVARERYGAILASGELGRAPWGGASAVCNPSVQAAGVASSLPRDVVPYAEAVCAAADKLPASTAGLWVGNWVEGAAAMALRQPESVGHLVALAAECACGNGLPHCGR